jgi:hypothetical protein
MSDSEDVLYGGHEPVLNKGKGKAQDPTLDAIGASTSLGDYNNSWYFPDTRLAVFFVH